MNDTIHSAFDEVTMPQACQDNILAAMKQNQKQVRRRPNYVRICAAAACLMAVILLLANPTVVEALENAITSTLDKFTDTTEEGTVILQYNSPDGKFHTEDVYDQDGNLIISRGGNDLTKIPAWYVEQNDRVFFAGNGEWIDVTGLISMDTPFTYIYTDQGGIIHYIAIGGVYDPDPEKWNVGYAEWYYDPNTVYANGIEGSWVGGYCDNYWDKDTDDDWPWLKKAKEEMGIPWK